MEREGSGLKNVVYGERTRGKRCSFTVSFYLLSAPPFVCPGNGFGG